MHAGRGVQQGGRRQLALRPEYDYTSRWVQAVAAGMQAVAGGGAQQAGAATA